MIAVKLCLGLGGDQGKMISVPFKREYTVCELVCLLQKGSSLRTIYGIHDILAIVNGNLVDEDHVLRKGDQVELYPALVGG